MAQVNVSLIDKTINNISSNLKELIQAKSYAKRVDGTIIGTGKADFTQGNTLYKMSIKGGKHFNMIDVPGIEGDESQFENMVKEAVARAHLILYVNGTNKKPEKKTAAKIKSYLGRGSKVYAICNVRGMPDAYEFEDDRVSILESHRGSQGTFQQTYDVLSAEIGKGSLIGGESVQGLLAFCGLAYCEGKTTIHPSREKDLIRAQKNYLKWFECPQSMIDFSSILSLSQMIEGKQKTYKEDIVEANKDKVLELLRKNESDLIMVLKNYHGFVGKLKEEIAVFEKSFDLNIDNFSRSVSSSLKNVKNRFFNNLTNISIEIAEEEFDNNFNIESRVCLEFENFKDQAESEFKLQYEKSIENLQEENNRAVRRLRENLKRVEYQTSLDFDLVSRNLNFEKDWFLSSLDMKNWKNHSLKIGNYFVSFAFIGLKFGPIGAGVGAAIGLVTGALLSLLDVFMSKDQKIRNLQKKLSDKINKLRKEDLAKLEQQTHDIVRSVEDSVTKQVKAPVVEIGKNFEDAESLMQGVINLMAQFRKKVEQMPYGAIEKI